MTSPTPLAGTDDLAAYLGAAPPNAAQAEFGLNAASGLVRTYCRWSITRVEDVTTWTVNGTGSTLLFVPTMALRSLTAVTVDGAPVDLSQVTYSASGVLQRPGQRWPDGAPVVVQGEHGYDTAPAELVAVVCSIVSRWLAMAGKGPVSSYRVGGVQITYARDGTGEVIGLDPTESRVLDLYRLPSVA